SLSLSDGSSNFANLKVDPLAGNYDIVIPTVTANDEICLKNLGNCSSGADRVAASVVVAPSGSGIAANYYTDGTSDEDEINTALTAAAGGKVYLAEGTYVADGTILVP